MLANIIIKSYPEKAENLVEIWKKHSDTVNNGLDFVTFINKRPKNPRNDNRRIAGLNAKSVSYLKADLELIKMSVENFLYLMAKFGVDIEVREIRED